MAEGEAANCNSNEFEHVVADRNAHATDLAVLAFGQDHLDPGRSVLTDAEAEAVRTEVYSAVLSLGGTITGEHGVGLTKRKFMEQQLGPRTVSVMRAIKDSLEPDGILNPGKLLPD